MCRSTIMAMALSLSLLMTPPSTAQQESHSGAVKKGDVPTITITKLDISDTTLELIWEIRNNTGQDAWIMAGLGKSEATISAFIDQDGQTLLMRRRLDLPWSGFTPYPVLNGKYARLRAGEILTESVSLAMPVWPVNDQAPAASGKNQSPEQLPRLAIEIGYYTGDFPDAVRRALEVDEKNPHVIPPLDAYYPDTITGWFKGLRGFNNLNELLRWRDDEILIPYTSQAFTGEQILRTTADNLRIPHEAERDSWITRHPPDLSPCTQIEIRYQPSALEYFFPYAGEKSLLSLGEQEYLRSMETIVVQDANKLMILVDELNNGERAAGIVSQRSFAHLVCYQNDEPQVSFRIYNDNSVVTEGRHRFEYPNGMQSLRMLTPRVKKIDLRVKCAANLKHQWRRFNLYEKIAKRGFLRIKRPYPPPKTWCDSLLRAYGYSERTVDPLDNLYRCQSGGQGKCHYAMNPNCRPDSSPDVVLLFETKAGWNQHGGSELFTFDNHDPKGGCVLLNDGTVKFIRTDEEQRQLRWE